jgi:hypothetical protein
MSGSEGGLACGRAAFVWNAADLLFVLPPARTDIPVDLAEGGLPPSGWVAFSLTFDRMDGKLPLCGKSPLKVRADPRGVTSHRRQLVLREAPGPGEIS